MDANIKKNLLKKIDKVILLLEAEFKKNNKSMIGLIIKRYKIAKDILEKELDENLDIKLFKIGGGTRAYLDAANDYMNPVLEEMYRAEKLLEDLFI